MSDELDQGAMRERRSTGRGGRRRAQRQLAIISWRDIPAQLTARDGDEQHKVLLHARFQHAIDRAAGVAGLTSTHDYVQEWTTTTEPLPSGDVQAHLDQRCAELEGEFPRDRLEAFVAHGGLDPTTASPATLRTTDATDTTDTTDTPDHGDPT